MPLKPLVYVCVMSNFNLPEWEACLAHCPSDVVLLVSDFEAARKGADQMEALLQDRLPGVVVHQPQSASMPLEGDDAIAAQAWLKEVLVPYLKRPALADKPRWLNTTGGTKSMQLALLTTVRWDQLDYTPIKSGRVQAIGLEVTPLAILKDLGRELLPSASAEEVARLYNASVTFGAPNPLWQRSFTLELAKRIYQGLAEQDVALGDMFAALRRLWIDGKEQESWQQREISLSWSEFLGSDALPDAALRRWLEAVEQLAPECWSVSDAGICLPGNRLNGRGARMQRALKAWLQSDWWEGLAFEWLREAGIPPEAIACNVHGGDRARDSSAQREADLLVHFQGRTTVVEVKVLPAPGQAPKEMENQVSGLAERFGRTEKVLLVSPLVKRSMTERQWEDFTTRCRANKVSLCDDRHSLLQALGLACEDTARQGEFA